MADNLPDGEVERLVNEVDHVRIRTEERLQSMVEQVADLIEKTAQPRHEEFIAWFSQKLRETIASPTRRCSECSGEGWNFHILGPQQTCTLCAGSGRIPKLRLNTKF